MPDKEKVIKGLEECAGNGNCTKCQYGKEKQALSCKKLLADALELLKSSRLIHTEHALRTVYDMDKDNFIQPRCKRNGGGWSSNDYCSNAERREEPNE